MGDSYEPIPFSSQNDRFVIWGQTYQVGDVVSSDVVAQMLIIISNPYADQSQKNLLRDIILHNGEKPNYQQLLSIVEDDSLPDEMPPTDEITVRAREAFIALGEHGAPELAAAIRQGKADHLIGIRGAVQVLRDLNIGVNALSEQRLPVATTIAEAVMVLPREPSAWERFGRWLVMTQHRFARIWTRYDRAQKQKLSLAAQIVLQKQQAVELRLEMSELALSYEKTIEFMRTEDAILRRERQSMAARIVEFEDREAKRTIAEKYANQKRVAEISQASRIAEKKTMWNEFENRKTSWDDYD